MDGGRREDLLAMPRHGDSMQRRHHIYPGEGQDKIQAGNEAEMDICRTRHAGFGYADIADPWADRDVMKRDIRKYPQLEYWPIKTSTVLACAGCLREIRILVPCFASSDEKYYHVGCKPASNPVVKGGIGPSVDSDEGGGG